MIFFQLPLIFSIVPPPRCLWEILVWLLSPSIIICLPLRSQLRERSSMPTASFQELLPYKTNYLPTASLWTSNWLFKEKDQPPSYLLFLDVIVCFNFLFLVAIFIYIVSLNLEVVLLRRSLDLEHRAEVMEVFFSLFFSSS